MSIESNLFLKFVGYSIFGGVGAIGAELESRERGIKSWECLVAKTTQFVSCYWFYIWNLVFDIHLCQKSN